MRNKGRNEKNPSYLKKRRRYLITGGTGFLGHELICQLIQGGYKNLRVVARNEGKLVELKNEFPSIEIIPGNIADSFIADKACKDAAGIFHLAASKHIGIAEINPRDCVSSNVIGTMNLLECSRIYRPDFIIGISTDKAARVNGVYGATKLLQERLFREYELLNPKTKYRTVRYGNVLYSTGSVLCRWKEKLQNNQEIIITDPNATRFYWPVHQAVALIFDCLKKSRDSKPHFFPMKSMRLGDLLEAMARKYLPKGSPLKVKTIGLQPGENKHEIIFEGGPDSSQSERFTSKEIMTLI